MDIQENEESIKNIKYIYSLNSNNKEAWDSFKSDINSENPNKKIIIYLKNKIIEEPNNELNLDIIDYIIDNGDNKFIDEIFQPEFFDTFINKIIETNNENKEIKDKALFLIKKWNDKFKDKYKLLLNIHNKIKNDGIIIPEKNFSTYDKYIQNDINKTKKEKKEMFNFDNMKEQINNL